MLTLLVKLFKALNNPSIEKLFSNAIGETIKNQAKKYSTKITSAISDKVGDLSSLDDFTKNFDQWRDQLDVNDGLLKTIKSGF